MNDPLTIHGSRVHDATSHRLTMLSPSTIHIGTHLSGPLWIFTQTNICLFHGMLDWKQLGRHRKERDSPPDAFRKHQPASINSVEIYGKDQGQRQMAHA